MQLVLISGLSGSGKSIALNVMEDTGYYCVDNLPASLLPELLKFLQEEGYERIAISIDVRSGETLQDLPKHLAILKQQGIHLKALFLEANDETLVKRFSETRRRHPLSDDNKTLLECIRLEREMLEHVGEISHHLDTSVLSTNALRSWIKDFIELDQSRITLLFQSFGFKHGLPLDADFIFDVRCLPNPHYDPILRPFTGKDEPVIDFLDKQPGVSDMFEDIRNFVEKWLPCFILDNRNYLTVAIGCTGGQHRSVYFTEKLAAYFRGNTQVLVRHRGLS